MAAFHGRSVAGAATAAAASGPALRAALMAWLSPAGVARGGGRAVAR